MMNVRNLSRRDKFCCMRVEKACYIFAVINVIVFFLCALSCIGLESFLITRAIIGLANNYFYVAWFRWLDIYLIFAVLCIVTVVFGIFAVLLLQGIRLNKPKLVMAYLYFGLVAETAMICATVTASAQIFLLGTPGLDYEFGFICGGIAIAVVICVIYGYILHMMRRTYLILLSRKQNNINNEQTVLYLFECLPASNR